MPTRSRIEQPKVARVKPFGSRAKGPFRPASDIDLRIDAPALSLSLSEKFALETRLGDLHVPRNVDLAIWQMIDQRELREHIERIGVDLMQAHSMR